MLILDSVQYLSIRLSYCNLTSYLYDYLGIAFAIYIGVIRDETTHRGIEMKLGMTELQSILTLSVAAATRPAIDEYDKQEFLKIAEFARNGLAAIRGLRRARTK